MKNASRCQFIASSGAFLVSASGLVSLPVLASTQHHHGGTAEGITIDSSLQNRCATCQYWGGMRKLNQDKSLVIAQSMGWCNNSDGPIFQKLTEADHHMKKPEIWAKWSAI